MFCTSGQKVQLASKAHCPCSSLAKVLSLGRQTWPLYVSEQLGKGLPTSLESGLGTVKVENGKWFGHLLSAAGWILWAGRMAGAQERM